MNFFRRVFQTPSPPATYKASTLNFSLQFDGGTGNSVTGWTGLNGAELMHLVDLLIRGHWESATLATPSVTFTISTTSSIGSE